MPELVANGPIIPVRLMNELDSGRAVFFCGAGISMGPASDLPSFSGLVDHVYEVNHLEPDAVEREALDLDGPDPDRRRPSLDKALGLLERPERLGAQLLRRTVVDRLSQPPVSGLTIHQAVIHLSHTKRGVRLITTNFDNRFVEAGLDEKLIDTSPKLPVPKPHNWSSLVHLHGRIVPGDDGSNLVLTAADFGRAYLTERWAARFITELFREFTVVFVGYSLTDPVMSYMVDALAAERAKGARFASAYAFAEHDGSALSEQRVRAGWLAKNVEPIPYDEQGDHKLLGDTLIEWARIRSAPYQARAEIALHEISKHPAGASDPVVERVCWALQDPVAAAALADAPPITNEVDFPKLEAWLDMFAGAGLLSRPAQDAGGKSSSQDKSPVRLVDGGTRTHNPPPLDNVTLQLGRWMARHLNVPQVLAWVLRNGGHLHPSLREQIHRNLARPDTDIPARLRHLWTILTNGDAIDEWKLLWTSDQLANAASDPERRRHEEQVIRSIAPRLDVRPGPSRHLSFRQYFTKKAPDVPPIQACGHLELCVGDRDRRHLVQHVLNDAGVLSRNAELLTTYLERALILLADGEAPDRYSFFYRPSIAKHAQNEHHDDWTHLIDLVRDSYFALVAGDPARAENLLKRWALSKHPLFRRLALHALTDNPRSDIRLARRLLVAGRRPGVWEEELRREVLRFLRLAGRRLPRELRTDIVRAVHAGPKSQPARSRTNNADYIHREKCLRLYKLVKSGTRLDKKSKMLADEYIPPAADLPEERDEFLSWGGEVRWVAPEEFAPRVFLAGSVDDMVEAVSGGRVDLRQFEGIALQQPVKAASTIRRLAKGGKWPEGIWQRFLWSIAGLRRRQKLSGRLENYVARVLSEAPEDLFTGVGSAAADFVKDLAEAYGIDREEGLRALWNKAWTGVRYEEAGGSDDPVTDALNHAAGKLAEAALIRLWKYEPKANEGLPEPVRNYFDAVTTDPVGHLGRVMLAARLNQLFMIDPKWTGEHLIPLLGPPDSDEARDLWSGFAWSPSVGPNLFAAFKEPFLDVLTSYERLRRRDENLVNLFVLVCLDAPHELTADEIRRVVNSLPESALVTALYMLASRITGDPDERARAWTEEVKPWLESYWPRAGNRNTAATSKAMIRLVVECGNAFPDAVGWSLAHLKAIGGHGLYRLETDDLPARHPGAVFELLKRVVYEDVLPWYDRDTLRRILNALKAAAPHRDADPEFQELYRATL